MYAYLDYITSKNKLQIEKMNYKNRESIVIDIDSNKSIRNAIHEEMKKNANKCLITECTKTNFEDVKKILNNDVKKNKSLNMNDSSFTKYYVCNLYKN